MWRQLFTDAAHTVAAVQQQRRIDQHRAAPAPFAPPFAGSPFAQQQPLPTGLQARPTARVFAAPPPTVASCKCYGR